MFALVDLFYSTLAAICFLQAKNKLVYSKDNTNRMALLYVMLSCAFVTFPYGVLCQVWYLIVSIPDLRFLPNFNIGQLQHIASDLSYVENWDFIGFLILPE